VARVLLRLKLRLLWAGLRTGGGRGAVGFVLALLWSLVAGVVIGGLFVLARTLDARPATDATAIAFAVVLLGWVLGPVVVAGSEGTLESDRLALFPLSRRQLMPGLLLAAVAGFGGLATVLILVGAVIGMAAPSPLALVTVAAAACHLLLCAGLSRLVTTAISGAVRTRRWRDVALFAGPLLGLSVNVAIQVLTRAAIPTEPGQPGHAAGLVRGIATVARFFPSAPAALAIGYARAGRIGLALLSLVAAAALVVGVVALWGRVLDRVLTSAGTRGGRLRGEARRPLIPRWLPFLPANRLGAVAAKELRLTWRDPRQRAALLAAMFIGFVPAFSLRVFTSTNPRLALAAALPAYALASTATNQYGYDGAAHWTNVAAGDDPAADLGGKNLARLVITAPFVALLAAVAVWRASSLAYLVPGVALAAGAFGMNLGFADIASVVAPLPMPDNPSNVFSAGNSGRGLAAVGPTLGVLFGGLVFSAPLLIVLLVTSSPAVLSLASMGCVLWGAGGWWLGFGYAVRRSLPRQPELLAALSTRAT
jgi:ABC-2 type transport system permease protein